MENGDFGENLKELFAPCNFFCATQKTKFPKILYLFGQKFVRVPNHLPVLAPVDDGPTVRAANHARDVRLLTKGDNS